MADRPDTDTDDTQTRTYIDVNKPAGSSAVDDSVKAGLSPIPEESAPLTDIIGGREDISAEVVSSVAMGKPMPTLGGARGDQPDPASEDQPLNSQRDCADTNLDGERTKNEMSSITAADAKRQGKSVGVLPDHLSDNMGASSPLIAAVPVDGAPTIDSSANDNWYCRVLYAKVVDLPDHLELEGSELALAVFTDEYSILSKVTLLCS